MGTTALKSRINAIEILRERSIPIYERADLAPLFDRIGESRIVMLGEASHGTHEYYTWRSYITKKLIEDKGFNIICVEGDWPDCYQINRYIRQYPSSGKSSIEVVSSFQRWPTWMWANWEIVALTDWLFEHNRNLPEKKKTGFYGLDVYSLWESMETIIRYLEKVDPSALPVAKKAFQCFEPYREEEGQGYARASRFIPDLCEEEVLELLQTIQSKRPQYDSDLEGALSAEQNAVVAVNAERYYRAMINGGPESWNIRDHHMEETLTRLLNFHRPAAKAIVWEHNTHIGDARATDMATEGMVNIGQLARKDHADKGVVLVGFGSYQGSVVAGSSWGAKMETMVMPDARNGSWEQMLHMASTHDKLILSSDLDNTIFETTLVDHRAIGVVYNPTFEKYGNYVPSVIPDRYDAFIYINTTQALHPLHPTVDLHKMPETFPFGV